MNIIHDKKLCEHKTFVGMEYGHCIKCGKAYKNCTLCFPDGERITGITGIKIDPIPKCQLTVTGSHIWKGIYERVWLDSEQEYRFEYKGYERCLACQLVNNLNN